MQTYDIQISVISPSGFFWVITFLLIAGFAWPAHAQESAPQDSLVLHEVEEGETLYSIARQYDVPLRQVQEWNDLDNYTIYIGQDLIVGIREESPEQPVDPQADPDPSATDPPVDEETTGEDPAADEPSELPPREMPQPLADQPDELPQPLPLPEPAYTTSAEDAPDQQPEEIEEEEELLPMDEEELAEMEAAADPADLDEYGWHEVEEGETLYSIAGRYELTTDTLRALNESIPNQLSEGDSLRLPPSFAGYFHTVEEGQTIADVARSYGVSVRGLQHVNQLETRNVTPGQQLLIPGRPAPEPAPRGTLPEPSFEGEVEVFPRSFEGRLMAGGVQYDPYELVVSHRELPIGTVVLLSFEDTGRNTFARVADRGPPNDELIMDISRAVQEALGMDEERGHVQVRIVEEPVEES